MPDQPSRSFDLLDERIQRWIWSEGWTELREAQERAIPAIVPAEVDVIVAAATAAGKTEAAMLPVLTNLLKDDDGPGLALYISPLKALINDQFGRLEPLCESLEVPIWPWHGDISSSSKSRFLKLPRGILIITPESLEAILCNRGFSAPKLFANLRYIVVDELHAFIGSERGKQLQSLMQRVELIAGKKIARIGLSATLGDMDLAADFLRPRAGGQVKKIVSTSESGQIKLIIKGYLAYAAKPELPDAVETAPSAHSITDDLYRVLRGSNNLVFPNRRQDVERYTHALRKMCEAEGVANEFWPHHGSLSRDLREETEAALKRKDRPATAICTNTLELGIDIGAVKCVVQIGTAPAVASLRQRLGRSGRRKGESSILRAYILEDEIATSSYLDTRLRDGLFELCAMTSLLLEGWVEPPKALGLHLSTLVQQLLSIIAQRGGMTAAESYRILCETGPFNAVSRSDYAELLSHLGRKDILLQESSGLLLHGTKGAALVNHYSFYAAFNAEEEFRIVAGTRTLGTVPILNALSVGDFILFAAKTWRVDSVDEESRSVYVTQHDNGAPPRFGSDRCQVHDEVRLRMRKLYETTDEPKYLDATAKRLMQEGRNAYSRYNLADQTILNYDGRVHMITWLGDAKNEAIVMLLKMNGIQAETWGHILTISSQASLTQTLHAIAAQPTPSPQVLLAQATNLCQEKWDWVLPKQLQQRSYASHKLDIAGAHEWIKSLRLEPGG